MAQNNDTQLVILISKIISYISCVLLIFLYILNFLSFKNRNNDFIFLTNIQLFTACFINSISYCLSGYDEDDSSTTIRCRIQFFINLLSELAKITIILGIIIGSFISCVFPDGLDRHYRCYVISTVILTWVFPLIITIVCLSVGTIQSLYDFCWVIDDNLVIIYFIFLVIMIIIFFIFLILTCVHIYKLLPIRKTMKFQIKDYLRRLITYSIVGMLYSLTVVLNLSAFVVNTVDEEKTLTLIAMETESLSNIIIPLIFGMTCDKLKNLKYVCSKNIKPEKTLESLDTSIITIPELKDLKSIYT